MQQRLIHETQVDVGWTACVARDELGLGVRSLGVWTYYRKSGDNHLPDLQVSFFSARSTLTRPPQHPLALARSSHLSAIIKGRR